ncbi:hypothetical protein SLEP1_g25772 [Rubroshorea leprosula]|uniref:Uncharacterized protein n=1 Tax=Rubroshorea leprosula TaxID=152421 RepID=A0AAV5JUM0_9ROSI|nr:hypothetical protein SLEP1_g25772 [Rubroshorea leprosula]
MNHRMGPRPDVDELTAQVFTLGTTEWRNIGATPPQLADVITQAPGTLVEGSLHWVTLVGGIYGIIPNPNPTEKYG